MILANLKDFDIEQIAFSGQCFRIDKINTMQWQIIANNRRLIINRLKSNEYEFCCSDEEYETIWSDYFDLQTDYSEFKKKIYETRDPYLIAAANYGWGIRILRQDLWETIVTFLISQRNNIPKIKRIIRRLCEPFGYTFPSPALLSDYSEDKFKQIGLGYRAKYLVDIVQSIQKNELDLSYLKLQSTSESLKYLQQFNGIGPKIANCIILYSLHKIDAFPIDVWIQRIIDNRYNGQFTIGRFRGFAGIVQQYMFFYERALKTKQKTIDEQLYNCYPQAM